MKYFALFLTILLLHGVASAEMRYWRQSDGSVFEGEYLQQKLGKAYFRDKDRKTHSIVITNLVASDVKYIEAMVPPDVNIKFKAKERAEEGRYSDANTKYLDAKVTLTKVGRKPFFGTLDAEIYLLRKEIGIDKDIYRILAKRTLKVQFPETAKSSVESELTAKIRSPLFTWYGQYRGWEYDGYLVVILDSGGEVLQTKTDLRWLDDEELEKFRQIPTYQFFDENCKKESPPRPEYWSGRTL